MKTTHAVLFLLVGSATTATAQNPPQAGLMPVTSQFNRELPGWLRMSGEERARMEYISGQGFKPVEDLYLLNRLRLSLDVHPWRLLRFSFQTEDSRVFGQNAIPAPASQKNSLDLRAGYVQVGTDEGLATLRAGRQGLDFGEGRLLCDANWSNVGRTFDAARLTLRKRGFKLDLFSGTAVKIDPVSFDEPTPGAHFHGAYGSLGGLVSQATIEPYVFWRLEHNYKSEQGSAGNLNEKTFGIRWAGKLPLGFDYASEIAAQRGSWAGDRVGAWMGHWVVGYTVADARHRPRVFGEYNRGSGDADSRDGHHGTFDTLFASSHDRFGLTDLFCASNIVHVRGGVQYLLWPKVTIGAAYDDYWLAGARDALYVGGKAMARSANGTAGTHVGQEIDMQVQWTVSRTAQLSAGYGHLFAGRFLQQTTADAPYHLMFWNLVQRF